jgi:exonuclease III
VPAILAGDYNVAPTDADIYDMRSWVTAAHVSVAQADAAQRRPAAGR